MAVKGSIAKAEITKKILETFNGSFLYDKEIRIPMFEEGAEVQIKITLTAAKTNVEHDSTPQPAGFVATSGTSACVVKANKEPAALTSEEKEVVAQLAKSLNLF